jgi:ribosome-associated translation inhibitor RaiA
MIEKIEITGNGYKVEETLRKHIQKKIGKLDRYLPKGSKKDVVVNVIVAEIGKSKGDCSKG